MGAISERLSPEGFVRGFYKDFISWLKESGLCLCTGPFRGCIPVSAHGHHRGTVHAPFSLPKGPEIWGMGQVSYQGMARIPFICLSSFKA
jgi:hypothetical protein